MNSNHTGQIYILLADNFDESEVVDCLCQLRDEGLRTQLVGISTQLMKGMHGLTIRPDISLSKLIKNHRPIQAVIVPGSSACVATLISDPRTHQLINRTLETEGTVAVMFQAQQSLASIQFRRSSLPYYLEQGSMSTSEFMNQLIKRVVV